MIDEATPREYIGHKIDRKAFRDRGQIELQVARLHHRMTRFIDREVRPPCPAPVALDIICARKAAAPAGRSEAPELGQRADGWVIGAMGHPRET